MLILLEYPYKVDPLVPRQITVDFFFLPLAYMLIYQFFTKMENFLIGISCIDPCIFLYLRAITRKNGAICVAEVVTRLLCPPIFTYGGILQMAN